MDSRNKVVSILDRNHIQNKEQIVINSDKRNIYHKQYLAFKGLQKYPLKMSYFEAFRYGRLKNFGVL